MTGEQERRNTAVQGTVIIQYLMSTADFRGHIIVTQSPVLSLEIPFLWLTRIVRDQTVRDQAVRDQIVIDKAVIGSGSHRIRQS